MHVANLACKKDDSALGEHRLAQRMLQLVCEVNKYEEVSIITSRRVRSDRMDAESSSGRSTF
jgi:hypothetical protein